MWFYKDRKASSSQAWFNWTLTARQGWNAARCNCRWTKLQIKGGNKMMKTITWEVFGRRNEGISGRRINVSSWQWVKPSCVHLWINSLHLASAAKGRRIEKKKKIPKAKGETWAAREILLQQSPEICPELWHLISAGPRVTQGAGRRKRNSSPCGYQGEKWPQARGQSCQNPQIAPWKISFLIINLLHLLPLIALKQLYLHRCF